MIKLLRDIKDSTTTTLATRVTKQPSSHCGLQFRASDIQKYLVEAAAGTMPVNINMLRVVITLHVLVTVDNKTTIGKVELEEGEKEKRRRRRSWKQRIRNAVRDSDTRQNLLVFI